MFINYKVIHIFVFIMKIIPKLRALQSQEISIFYNVSLCLFLWQRLGCNDQRLSQKDILHQDIILWHDQNEIKSSREKGKTFDYLKGVNLPF